MLWVPHIAADEGEVVVMFIQSDGRGEGRQHEFIGEKTSEVSCFPSEAFSSMGV